MLREAAFWRMHDLMTQSYELHVLERGLGARILLRSGFETLATLVYWCGERASRALGPGSRGIPIHRTCSVSQSRHDSAALLLARPSIL